MEQANKKAQASASERGFILKLPADEPNKAAEVLGMTNTATALSKGCRQRMGYGKAAVEQVHIQFGSQVFFVKIKLNSRCECCFSFAVRSKAMLEARSAPLAAQRWLPEFR
jgi:hypothetical protein